MPLEGHWERVNTPLRRTTRREGRLVVALVAVLVAGALAIGLYALLHGGSSKVGAGCIEVTGAHSTGGATIRACGPDAARWCRLVVARDDPLSRQAQERCRETGYR